MLTVLDRSTAETAAWARPPRAPSLARKPLRARFAAVLAGRYPTLQRMLGDDSFFALANRFFAADIAGQSDCARLPNFLRAIAPAASTGYLADIARLDLAVLQVAQGSPAVVLSSRYPVVSAWHANQSGGDGTIRRWGPETAVVTRGEHEVEVSCLLADRDAMPRCRPGRQRMLRDHDGRRPS